MMTAILTNIEQILIEEMMKSQGFILEPLIQGATGLFVHPKGFLKEVEKLCKNTMSY